MEELVSEIANYTILVGMITICLNSNKETGDRQLPPISKASLKKPAQWQDQNPGDKQLYRF